MATMYDATEPDTIPSSVPAPNYCMGYVDGKWPSYAAMKARFPTATPVSISAIPGQSSAWAQGCDGEGGDYDPAKAAAFSAAKLATGVVPFEYCDESNWPSYREACAAIGVNPSAVDWLIAAYPGPGPVVYPGSIGHQYADLGSYDISVIADGWVPGRLVHMVTRAPFVAIASTSTGKGYWEVGSDGGVFSYGDAAFEGSEGGKPISAPIVGITPTPTDKGYWLLGSDGATYAFGDAQYLGGGNV